MLAVEVGTATVGALTSASALVSTVAWVPSSADDSFSEMSVL